MLTTIKVWGLYACYMQSNFTKKNRERVVHMYYKHFKVKFILYLVIRLLRERKKERGGGGLVNYRVVFVQKEGGRVNIH